MYSRLRNYPDKRRKKAKRRKRSEEETDPYELPEKLLPPKDIFDAIKPRTPVEKLPR